MYTILETSEYIDWFKKQNFKEQAQVQARIAKIRIEGHFGLVKKLEKRLAELKWRNGKRIYFSMTQDDPGNTIILLLGGNKNTQSRDINRARSIIKKLGE